LKKGLLFVGSWLILFLNSYSQQLNVGLPIYEEYYRRQQLAGELGSMHSFMVRPLRLPELKKDLEDDLFLQIIEEDTKIDLLALPLISRNTYNSKRPYGWGNKGMLPNVGFQTYLSTGIFAKLGFFELQLQPEFVFGQNRPFLGFGSDFSTPVLQSRFFYWNNGDNPERFGTSPNSRLWWGQSSAKLNFGAFAIGISTENIWWGPGQFNSLTFSDNAEGFPHITLETRRPAKTFLGNFEGQLIVGRLENSLLPPTQIDFLNQRYFKDFDGDWRYLNGISISYNPIFLPNLFFGFSRTFQQYNSLKGDKFLDWFPIFEVFQKEGLFSNGNSVSYDSKGQDQQVVVSFRYLVPSAKFEIYGEYGRRDHAFNWREFILNPEHARAYLIGFQKLIALNNADDFLQIRGEYTHQQESVNRYIRYPGLIGNQTWHTHGLARGFVNRGEALGVGAGVGSNVMTFEISKVSKLNKRGILLERLANHQDFFYRAFGRSSGRQPWIDYSIGLLWDQSFEKLTLGTKIQLISSYNYQWQSNLNGSRDFPQKKLDLALYLNLNLLYRFGD
jgi:hypothetical protein